MEQWACGKTNSGKHVKRNNILETTDNTKIVAAWVNGEHLPLFSVPVSNNYHAQNYISSYKSGTNPNRLKFFNFLHKAREEFMDSENLERFSRALNHNI